MYDMRVVFVIFGILSQVIASTIPLIDKNGLVTSNENRYQKPFEVNEHVEDRDGQSIPHVGKDKISTPEKYIVIFRSNIEAETELEHLKNVAAITSNTNSESGYSYAGIHSSFHIGKGLRGYIGQFAQSTLEYIQSQGSIIHFIERDQIVTSDNYSKDLDVPWGLARISRREKIPYINYRPAYIYDDEAGSGVNVYVLDSGIDVEHEEFQGRAEWGTTVPLNDIDEDLNGHGTHCAGIIGSRNYGVAKKTNLIAVKVLRSDGNGEMSDVIKGIEYIVQDHKRHSNMSATKSRDFKGSVVNVSLGAGLSFALNMAVDAAVDAGVHFAVAAGNEADDACNSSPAAAKKAITAAASSRSDSAAFFSNYGPCVDIYAPGVDIMSTFIGGEFHNSTRSLSGTSMSAPHVAGLISYFLSLTPDKDSQFEMNSVTPGQLKKRLQAFATWSRLEVVPLGTPNALVYNGAGKNLTDFWQNT